MSQGDSASISFNINLPREIVQDYFEGLAKVERAKSQQSSNVSHWAFALAPLVAALVSKGSTEKPTPKEKKPDSGIEAVANLISEIIKPEQEPEPVPCSGGEKCQCGEYSTESECQCGETCQDDMKVQCNACFFETDGTCHCDDPFGEFAKQAEEKKPDAKKQDAKKPEGKTVEKPEDGKKEEAPKRAVYEEPDPSEPPPNPFANIAEMFNGEGMAEMMKNIQPAMENFQQMFNGKGAGMAPKPAGPKSRGPKKTAKKSTIVKRKPASPPPPASSSPEKKESEESVTELVVETSVTSAADVTSDLDVKAPESATPAETMD